MKAVVFHGVGDIRLDNVPDPKLEASTDAIVRLTASAICGTDLNRTFNMGNCSHRKYIPELVSLVQSGTIDSLRVLTQREPLTSVIDAYKTFAEHRPGWVKVALELVN